MNSLRLKTLWTSLALLLLLVPACYFMSPGPDKLADEWRPNRLAVLPFELASIDEARGRVISPLTGAAFSSGEITDNATLVLDHILDRTLTQISDVSFVSYDQTGVVFERLRRNDITLNLRQAIILTGKQLGVDGVLIGHVYRFAQRVGTPFAAEYPASAAFDLALVRVSDGMVVWKNSFDEAQRALSDDLFSLRQYSKGIRWFTVEEYAEYGMEVLLDRFPWSKRADAMAPAQQQTQNPPPAGEITVKP